MITPISAQPIGFATLPPVAFQALSETATTPAGSATVASGSSIVDLSGVGRLLSTVAAGEDRLAALQARPADADPASTLDAAQRLVDTVNELQGSVIVSQSLADVLPSIPPANPATTLNDLAATALAEAASSFDSLAGIGIEVLPAASPASGPALRLAPDDLLAASAADPAATQARLDQAIQSVANVLAGFETQAAGASAGQASPGQLLGPVRQAGVPQQDAATIEATAGPGTIETTAGSGTVATEAALQVESTLLSLLPADSILNGSAVSDLDLAAGEALLATRLAELATEIAPTAADDLLANRSANPAPVAASPAAAEPAPEVPAPTVVPAQPTPIVAPAAPADASLAGLLAGARADTLAAERRASEATAALQNLLANPVVRTADILVDPAYAALIASVRLSDFVPPTPLIDPRKLAAEYPEPVLAIVRVRAVEERI